MADKNEIISSEITKINIPSTIPSTINDYNYLTELIISNKTNCSIDDMIESKCSLSFSNGNITDIYNQIKSQIKSNKSMIISTEKITFQISPLKEQKSNNNPNVSSIDLGDCEEKIKQTRGLTEEDDLIIYKIDIKSEDLSTTYVQYEIYDPRNYSYISLDICEGLFINVYTPVTLKESTESLFNRMSGSGYDLFNLNDSFYNDICSTYTTKDGTDLTLLDRKNLIYDNNANISMCQEGCTLLNYNATLKKANCDCKVQTEETKTNVNEVDFNKKDIASSFYKTLTNSNFLVLKCYKLVFSKKGQKNNIGSYIMSGINFIFIVLLFILIFKGKDRINRYIHLLLNQKLLMNEEEKQIFGKNNVIISDKIKTKKFNNDKNNESKNKINENKNNKINSKKESNKQKNKQDKKSKSRKPDNKKGSKNKNKSKSKNKNYPPKKTKIKSGLQSSLLSTNKSLSKQSPKLSQINIILNNKDGTRKKINKFGNKVKYDKFSVQTIKDEEKNSMNKLNDEELNELYYELAIELDKRTYFQYYTSLLKKKHLILFAFCPSDDYNIPSIKISTLLLGFSLYFTINGFFFSDETMNKINEDKGAFNFLFQIPQILYSTLICAVINMVIKRLSLTEKQILLIKQQKGYKEAEKKSKEIKCCLKAKLIIFFVISFLLMLFFWYFISCFCAVYKNTQWILIKDTLISFGLSMLYPFGLNLLPGMFRIPALRAKNKNMKYLYQFSGFVALI